MAEYVLIKGYFDTVDLFNDEIEAFLTSRGDKCLFINYETSTRDIKALIKRCPKNPPRAAIVFNNLGYNLEDGEGHNIWDEYGIEYLDILMDHPFHFGQVLPNLPRNTRLFVVDRNHVDFVKKYYPDISDVRFMPHGGCATGIEQIKEPQIKDIDILYAGNLSRVLIENLIPDFGEFKDIDGAEFSGESLKTLIENPSLTTEEVIVSGLRDRGLSLSPDEELHYITSFRFIDGFAVSYFRELSVRILVENGFRVHALGVGWESCDWADNDNLICHGKVPAGSVLSFMKRSKVILNTLTWFKQGAHDRIFNGMLSGGAVLTDTSGYLDENFYDGRDLAFFELKKMNSLPEIADRLLRDNEYRDTMVLRALETAKEKHTWEHRIMEASI